MIKGQSPSRNLSTTKINELFFTDYQTLLKMSFKNIHNRVILITDKLRLVFNCIEV